MLLHSPSATTGGTSTTMCLSPSDRILLYERYPLNRAIEQLPPNAGKQSMEVTTHEMVDRCSRRVVQVTSPTASSTSQTKRYFDYVKSGNAATKQPQSVSTLVPVIDLTFDEDDNDKFISIAEHNDLLQTYVHQITDSLVSDWNQTVKTWATLTSDHTSMLSSPYDSRADQYLLSPTAAVLSTIESASIDPRKQIIQTMQHYAEKLTALQQELNTYKHTQQYIDEQLQLNRGLEHQNSVLQQQINSSASSSHSNLHITTDESHQHTIAKMTLSWIDQYAWYQEKLEFANPQTMEELRAKIEGAQREAERQRAEQHQQMHSEKLKTSNLQQSTNNELLAVKQRTIVLNRTLDVLAQDLRQQLQANAAMKQKLQLEMDVTNGEKHRMQELAQQQIQAQQAQLQVIDMLNSTKQQLVKQLQRSAQKFDSQLSELRELVRKCCEELQTSMSVELMCHVCFDLLDSPVLILPCKHSACMKCLRDVNVESMQCTCAECLQQVKHLLDDDESTLTSKDEVVLSEDVQQIYANPYVRALAGASYSNSTAPTDPFAAWNGKFSYRPNKSLATVVGVYHQLKTMYEVKLQRWDTLLTQYSAVTAAVDALIQSTCQPLKPQSTVSTAHSSRLNSPTVTMRHNVLSDAS